MENLINITDKALEQIKILFEKEKQCFEKAKPVTLDELSKKYIQYIFEKNDGAKEQTAKDLGIDRKTLYRKLKEMHLN
jgi:DNA-binding NtrC family response regulator